MTKKSKTRTIITIVVCAILLLPLIFGLLRLLCGGNSGFSQFLSKCKLDFWSVSYSNDISNFGINGKEPYYSTTLPDFIRILTRTDASYGLFSSMTNARISCDTEYAKGGAFTLGTVSRFLAVLICIVAIALIVIEVLRLLGIHFNVLENALAYTLFFLGITFIIVSIFFFVGTSCKANVENNSQVYICNSMKFTAQIGWWIVAICSIFMGIFLTSTKPHETNPED